MELAGVREFRVELADSWNNGKGGNPQKWVVFWGNGKPPVLCNTLQEVATVIEAKAAYAINRNPPEAKHD
jgi:hypothetical protein